MFLPKYDDAMIRLSLCAVVASIAFVHANATAESAEAWGSRRYGAYVPRPHDLPGSAAASIASLYDPPTAYSQGYYELPYRVRYGLYRPWYQSYVRPNYYGNYNRPWYTHPYAMTQPIHAAPAEPCYDGCYYW